MSSCNCLHKPFLIPLIMTSICLVLIPVIFFCSLKHKLVYASPLISDFGNVGYYTWKASPRKTSAYEKSAYILLVNCVAILMFFIMYIRYRKVRYVCDNIDFHKRKCTDIINRINISIGSIAIVLLPILAVLSWNDSLVLKLGCGICGLLFIYEILDVVLSFKIYPAFGAIWHMISKILLLIISIVSFIVYVTNMVKINYPPFLEPSNKVIYTQDIRGYDIHFKACIWNWILSFVTFIYFGILSMVDFYDIYFSEFDFTTDCNFQGCNVKK